MAEGINFIKISTIQISRKETTRFVELSSTVKNALTDLKTIDFKFYKKLPLLHTTYLVANNLHGNQFYYTKYKISESRPIKQRTSGTLLNFDYNINVDKLSVVINYLGSIPFCINFSLFSQYETLYPSAFKKGFRLKRSALSSKVYPNPQKKPI